MISALHPQSSVQGSHVNESFSSGGTSLIAVLPNSPPRPATPVLNHAHVAPPSASSPSGLEPAITALSLQDTARAPLSSDGQADELRWPAIGSERRFSGTDKGKGKARAEDVGPAEIGELYYRPYRSEEEDLGELMRLVEEELSEPYNIYTFRYFLIEWPHLAFLVYPSPSHKIPIGTIVCKQDQHRNRTNRGYIAMLSVDRKWRRRGIASELIRLAIDEMTRRGAHEIVLETECDNSTSLALYESLGFMREKSLQRFYSNGKDAFRLLLALPNHPYLQEESAEEAENARWLVGQGPDWLEDLGAQEAFERGLGGPEIGGWGEPKRAGTPRPGDTARDREGGWKPELPPRPSEWDGMYT